jgi:hypothetical protein
LLGRRLPIRSEPVFEVPDSNLMLNLGLFNRDRNRRILMDLIDPIVRAKNDEASGYSLVEAARGDFDGVFRAARVEAKLAFRFYFARHSRLCSTANQPSFLAVTEAFNNSLH